MNKDINTTENMNQILVGRFFKICYCKPCPEADLLYLCVAAYVRNSDYSYFRLILSHPKTGRLVDVPAVDTILL